MLVPTVMLDCQIFGAILFLGPKRNYALGQIRQFDLPLVGKPQADKSISLVTEKRPSAFQLFTIHDLRSIIWPLRHSLASLRAPAFSRIE